MLVLLCVGALVIRALVFTVFFIGCTVFLCCFVYVYCFGCKEIGLEVNADKTKYMVMSREQTAGLSHTMKVDNSSIERLEEFKYLGTTLTNQNSIQKEIKSGLKLGNACYHSVQKLLSSSLLFKNKDHDI